MGFFLLLTWNYCYSSDYMMLRMFSLVLNSFLFFVICLLMWTVLSCRMPSDHCGALWDCVCFMFRFWIILLLIDIRTIFGRGLAPGKCYGQVRWITSSLLAAGTTGDKWHTPESELILDRIGAVSLCCYTAGVPNRWIAGLIVWIDRI